MLLKPLPYPEPDRIVMIWADNPTINLGIHELPPSQLDILDRRSQAHSLERIAGVSSATEDLAQHGDSQRVGAVGVTADFFQTARDAAASGKNFSPPGSINRERTKSQSSVTAYGNGNWGRIRI